MKKWITCEELCSHWGITIYDLTDLVSSGKLRPYHADDLSKIEFGNYDTFVIIEPGITGADPFTLTVDEVKKLVFRIFDIEEYENKNGITSNTTPTNPSQLEQKITETEQKAFEGHFEDAVIISDLKDENEKLKQTENSQEITDSPPVLSTTHKSVNFFKRKGKYWEVGYENEIRMVSDLDGIRYIVTLLERPGEAVSCVLLYQIAKRNQPVGAISDTEAIKEGLMLSGAKTRINGLPTNPLTKEMLESLDELRQERDICTNDSNKWEHLDKEIKEYEKAIENGTDMNSIKDVQSIIINSMGRAYKTLYDEGMKKLMKHLKNNIKSGGNYNYIYTGHSWDISQ